MAYKIEGESCPVCKAYLFPEDDIVFCPICGAPHHRDCYASIGKCGLQDLHGTDEQYTPKRDDDNIGNQSKTERNECCPKCGKEKVEEALFCPYCGNDFAAKNPDPQQPQGFGASQPPMGFYTPFVDPYGGIPHDGSVKIDGESVEDVKKFVFSNTHRYIPLFFKQNKKNKTGWNWAAFLFPHCWLFFRKQYNAGIIAIALVIFSAVLAIPLNSDLNEVLSAGGQVVSTYPEQLELILSALPNVSPNSIALAAVGSFASLATSIYFGLMGDWHYRQHTLETIKSIREDSELEDKDAAFFKKGATSLWGFLIAYLIADIAPQIIAMFI